MNTNQLAAMCGDVAEHLRRAKAHSENLRAEIAKVVDMANASGSRPDGLGPFSIAPLRHGADHNGYLQIRAARTAAPDDVEFRFLLPATGDIEIKVPQCSASLIEAAQVFVGNIDAAPVREARAEVATTLDTAAHANSRPRLVAIGFTPDAAGTRFTVTVDVVTLGEDLQEVTERVLGWDVAEVQELLTDLVTRHLARDAMRAQNLATGTRGWLDGAARRALEMSGLNPVDCLRSLRDGQVLHVAFDRANGQQVDASLFWTDGVVRCDMRPTERTWTLEGTSLTIDHPGLPDTVLDAWNGRRIGDLIDQECIPPDATVVGFPEEFAGTLCIELEIPRHALAWEGDAGAAADRASPAASWLSG